MLLLQSSATLLHACSSGDCANSLRSVYDESDGNSLSMLQSKSAEVRALPKADAGLDPEFVKHWGTTQSTQYGNDGAPPQGSEEHTSSSPSVVMNIMKKNRIVMQMAHGCSGSDFVSSTLQGLMKKHGVETWTPSEEFLSHTDGAHDITGKKYCTTHDGTALKWPKDPVDRLKAAQRVLSGKDVCEEGFGKKPTILFFEGRVGEEIMKVLPYLESIGSQSAQVIGVDRKSRLETHVCAVRECLAKSDSRSDYPVRADGTKNDLCHQKQHGRGDAGTDERHQVHLESKNLAKVLDGYHPLHQSIKKELDEHGFDVFPSATLEELAEYEYDSSERALKRSVIAFGQVLGGIGIVPSLSKITDYLKATGRSSRQHEGMWKAIWNYKEVQTALRGTSYQI